MFPTGLPGIGLLAIRVTVAAMLLVDGSPYGVPQSMGRAIGSLVAAVCLVFGVLTPYAAAFAGCLEFWRLCARDSVDLFPIPLDCGDCRQFGAWRSRPGSVFGG